jgi:predicted amidohydrolase
MAISQRVAIVQFCSSEDAWANLAQVNAFVQEATDSGADLVCFPENILYRGRRSKFDQDFILSLDESGQMSDRSDFSRSLKEFAETWKISVSLGSVLESSGNSSKPFNSHWIIRPNAPVISYHKIHLFHFSSGEIHYRESEVISGGSDIVTADLGELKLGLSICFDLRFPELYRKLVLEKKANVLLVPSAFTRETGEAHWHALLQARAIENQSYVIAAAQWGWHLNEAGQKLYCYGHSLAYDPWGKLIAESTKDRDDLVIIDISGQELERRRLQLPSLASTFFI